VTDSATPTAISPVQGTRRFRRNARLALEDGALVATDRRRRHHRFPLDGSPESPARFDETFSSKEHGRGQFVYLDGRGQALVIGFAGDWDGDEQIALNEAAGIPEKLTDPPLPPLRSDGCRLEDVKWAQPENIAAVAPVGMVVAFATNADFLPGWLGWPVVVMILVYAVAALSTGVTARPRNLQQNLERYSQDREGEDRPG
jgi:hypothetical protein